MARVRETLQQYCITKQHAYNLNTQIVKIFIFRRINSLKPRHKFFNEYDILNFEKPFYLYYQAIEFCIALKVLTQLVT